MHLGHIMNPTLAISTFPPVNLALCGDGRGTRPVTHGRIDGDRRRNISVQENNVN